jgi:hypothetical protein
MTPAKKTITITNNDNHLFLSFFSRPLHNFLVDHHLQKKISCRRPDLFTDKTNI